jgi:hypothetical protein
MAKKKKEEIIFHQEKQYPYIYFYTTNTLRIQTPQLQKNKKKFMTSIEWLIDQINKHWDNKNVNSDELINQAKLLHKQEIIKAFDESENYYYQYLINHKPKIDSETYYQETFVSKVKIKFTEEEWSELNNGSKGSDDETQPATYKVDRWKENDTSRYYNNNLGKY